MFRGWCVCVCVCVFRDWCVCCTCDNGALRVLHVHACTWCVCVCVSVCVSVVMWMVRRARVRAYVCESVVLCG